jgi:hypothetical protein
MYLSFSEICFPVNQLQFRKLKKISPKFKFPGRARSGLQARPCLNLRLSGVIPPSLVFLSTLPHKADKYL